MMNKKQLKFNKFGYSILNDFELFYMWVENIYYAYPKSNNKENVVKVQFRWFWNNYNGKGEVFYYFDTKTLCNKFGENNSSLTISSNSKRQQINGRHTCSLYNDQTMVELFNKILNMIDLSRPQEYPY